MTDPGKTTRRPVGSSTQRCLVVIGESSVEKFDLPESGDISIGRDDACDIKIDHDSISRRHAVLHLGATMTIEDTGSTNGTSVREQKLTEGEPVPVQLAEVIDLGSVMVIVQQRTASAPPVRRIWSHSYFEARLAEECTREPDERGEFCVARIRCSAPTAGPVIEEMMRTVFGAAVIGRYAPGEYEVLLVDTATNEGLSARIRDRLATKQITAEVGSASYPRDGSDADALLAAAAPHAATAVAPDTDTAMHGLHRLVKRIALGTINVLILGETGVGKEVLAETVHRESRRASKPFLRLHCAALSESLLESELFGHEKGAFTGAVNVKQGLLETAEGGTVFLDEIGELPMSIQVKLLRVIETREVMRVGGLKPKLIDVRFVAATNRDLEAEIAKGTFRSDLYFRLNGISLSIPPLRSRVSEIRGLADRFLAQGAGESKPTISSEAYALMESYQWPGNIRELRNVIERAALLAGDDPIRPEHLPLEKMQAVIAAPPSAAAPTPDEPIERNVEKLQEQIDEIQKDAIVDALAKCAGNQSEAAALLGISRRALVYKLDQYGLPRPRKGRSRKDD